MRVALILVLMAPLALAQPAEEPTPPLGGDTLPPLSLSDAQWLANRAQLVLEGHGSGDSTSDLPLARLMIQCVIDYVQMSDQRRSSLTDYDWVYLGKDVITPANETVEFTLVAESPVPQVQVIALQATRTIVEVRSITVETTDTEPISVRPTPTLDPDLPGWTFLDLPDQVAVTRVTVSAVTASDVRPRLKIRLGQTEHPELLRQSLYHLLQARSALVDEEDIDRAVAELELARRLIVQAEEIESE